ncbi:hypothetical protein RHMOL_Rhmol11G0031600 [Rhododendron molle]|uniref:Uncharacterized protein n=1 Tax=Rhododendron molle TaxID=49168 RepID=A0ACC0LPS0_RHOML|nr:hypothetical protein RHMOL_Rhmol11G0031600 [Rhododendron molle]
MGPLPYPHPEPRSSAVVGGMLPDEPSIVDLGGDPNTVSSESSSSSEESENIIVYYADWDPSPTPAATFEAREPPLPMDSHESVGQVDSATDPITATAAQLLKGEEEAEELPLPIARGPPVGQHKATPPSPPSGSHQQSICARVRSTESFLGRIAVLSPGVSNASHLQGNRPAAGRDSAREATGPHSSVCSTSQAYSPRPSVRHTVTPPAQPSLNVENRQLEVNEELLEGPTSITNLDLNSLFKDMTFLPTDDI